MALNENCFIRFTGSFTPLPFSINAVGFSTNLYSNLDFVDFNPLSLSFASLNINPDSFEIESAVDGFGADVAFSSGILWNPDTSTLRVYRPEDLTLTNVYINFHFFDYAGNISNSATINIIISSVVVAWVAYPATAVCNVDVFGQNNGFLSWSQLMLINVATGSTISPFTTKPNVPSDPDYVAPITDLITCPVPSGISTYAPLRISNNSLNGANPIVDFIIITQITLACSSCGTGGAPLLITLPCNIRPGESQSFNVPAITWDTGLTISYQVNQGGDMDTAPNPVLWKSNSVGTVDNYPTGGPHPVDNSGIYGNFGLTVNPIYGTTIFCQ